MRTKQPVPFAVLPVSFFMRGERYRTLHAARWLFLQECGWDPWIKAKYAKGFKP